MTFPEAGLTLVVAMASDKDHLGFARECLSGKASIAMIIIFSVLPGCNVQCWGVRKMTTCTFMIETLITSFQVGMSMVSF